MFWRGRERDVKDQNGGVPCGQVRVLVVGDSGVGKSSLVNLIVKGFSISRPPQTIGCSISLKHITYGSSGSSSSSFTGDNDREFFIELWDICGHERYKDCRTLFYSQINGVVFVHDLSQRRTKTSLHKWAAEIAINGTFSAPLGFGGPGGLPVPFIVIGNKAEVASKEGVRGSSGNLVDAARQWVEKQGLLPSSEELPLTETFPGNGGIVAAAKESRYDKEAVTKFFRMLIRRRYFSDELPTPTPWAASPPQRLPQRLDDDFSEHETFYRKHQVFLTGDAYKYNMLPPLPAQHNLMPPPSLYPQQPVAASEDYTYYRFSLSTPEISNTARSKRSDINV